MDTIDRIRDFNRFYTTQLGVLERGFLGSGRTLAEIRILYEVGTGQEVTARALAKLIGMDEGQLSRIVSRLERDDQLERRASPQDARKRVLSLTPMGHEVLAQMVKRSRASVGRQMAHLSPFQQRDLAAQMEGIRAAMTAPAPVRFRGLQPGDIGWLLQRHAELYMKSDGFNAAFEVLVAEVLTDFVRNHDPARERAWIAHRGAQRLGSVFCVQGDAPNEAKLRLFMLEPAARGLGLGNRMLDMCIRYARDRGNKRLTLWTHESHRAACALYAKHGFRLTASKPVHDFGVDLVRQNWKLEF